VIVWFVDGTGEDLHFGGCIRWRYRPRQYCGGMRDVLLTTKRLMEHEAMKPKH
jgi:hypothetical protein